MNLEQVAAEEDELPPEERPSLPTYFNGLDYKEKEYHDCLR